MARRAARHDVGMPTYLAFLRAINLGPTRKFPKESIRAAVGSLGFTGVETHINTGNVRFTTSMRSPARIEAALERAFLADRGFEVPTIVFTPTEIVQIAADAAALAAEHPDAVRHYVELLRTTPDPELAAVIETRSSPAMRFVVRGRAVHGFVPPNAPTAPSAGPVDIARLVGVSTNRNANVVATLAAKWC